MLELIATVVMTHITIVCVTVYLHRGQAHRGLVFHPILEHFFRFWLWLTTGMVTRQWVAIHRKHHAFSDRFKDPHSPVYYGVWRVLFGGAFLYHAESKNASTIEKYGLGTPDDWVERNIYTPYSRAGIILLLFINLLCFSWWGVLIWGIQMIWIPFWAAGVINGLGHSIGYKNGKTRDNSRNLIPWGIVIGGEELHNNHHIEPVNPKLSRRWFEFDIGWMWIQIFRFLGLLTVKKLVATH